MSAAARNNFPELVLGPEQLKVIQESEHHNRCVLVGEAGCGKTFILLYMLYKNTSKHLSEPDCQKVVFVIPEAKTGLKAFVEKFVEDFCNPNYVYIQALEQFCDINVPQDIKLILFDEIYPSIFDNLNEFSHVSAKIVVAVRLVGGPLDAIFSCELPSGWTTFNLLSSYRNPYNISLLCWKLRRLIYMAGSTLGPVHLNVALESCLKVNDEDSIQIKHIDCYSEIGQEIAERKEETLLVADDEYAFQSEFMNEYTNRVYVNLKEYEVLVRNLAFTGVQYETVVILLMKSAELTEFNISLLTILYHSISRSTHRVILLTRYPESYKTLLAATPEDLKVFEKLRRYQNVPEEDLFLLTDDENFSEGVALTDYNLTHSSPYINKTVIPTTDVKKVTSDRDLLLRTTIDNPGKKIEFWAMDTYDGFRGKIEVTFPPFSVLGEEKVYLEIIPEHLVGLLNERSGKLTSSVPVIITPILHIDRENYAPFLRDVEISLPIFNRFLGEKIKYCDNILVENGRVHFRESKFTPKAVCYDQFERVLRALRIDTHLSLSFRKLGVYLLVEQFPQNKFLFDLRPFRDEEEHRLYRMDETKTFRMIVNPQQTDASINDSSVFITIQDPIILENHEGYRNVEGNRIKFTFPNLNYDVDCFNERKVTVTNIEENQSYFRIRLEFDADLFNEKGIDCMIDIPLHSEDALTRILTRRVLPSQGMLLEFLKRLGSNWIKFLSKYLKVEVRYLKEFIDRDIKFSLPPSVLSWSEDIKKRLKTETDIRELQVVLRREELVNSLTKNYQTPRDLMKAKAEILEILRDSKVLADDHGCSAALTLESRETLAEALLFKPITELREAMYASFDQEKLFSPTPDIDLFIDSGDLPESEGTT